MCSGAGEEINLHLFISIVEKQPIIRVLGVTVVAAMVQKIAAELGN